MSRSSGSVIFSAVCGGLIAGILIEEYATVGVYGAAALLLMGFGAALFSQKERVPIGIALFCMSAALGAARTAYDTPPYARDLMAHVGESISLRGTIVREPDERSKRTRLVVRATHLDELELEEPVRILASTVPYANHLYGDVVRVSGTLRVPEDFGEEGRVFPYRQFLLLDGIVFEVPFARVTLLERSKTSLMGALFALKNTFRNGVSLSLQEPHASLALGITIGDKRSLPPALANAFQVTGLTHVVVLSGYNIAVVVAVLTVVLGAAPRTVRFVLGVSLVSLFVLMTGASPAGVRAGIMASVALLAGFVRRRYEVMRALALAISAMLLYEPRALLYDPGFQLSVAATIGVIVAAPVCSMALKRFVPFGALRELVATTLGAQLLVFPLLARSFGTVSLIALPANILALPAVPPAMVGGMVTGVAGAALGVTSVVVGYPVQLLLSYIEWVATSLSEIPFAVMSVPPLSVGGVALLYVFIGLLLIALRQIAPREQPNSDF